MAGNRDRRYITKDYENTPLFLVYKKDNNKLSSDGPYTNFKKAHSLMCLFLSQGICSWVVSYNERKI